MLNRMRKFTEEREQGFTLIELLVVIIIIGILAAIAIPVFLNQRKKGVDASMKSDLKSAATAEETWNTDNPGGAGGTVDLSSTGLSVKASPNNTIAAAVSGGGYCLRIGNAGSSKGSATTYMYYDSLDGGLKGFYTPTANVGACGGAALTWSTAAQSAVG